MLRSVERKVSQPLGELRGVYGKAREVCVSCQEKDKVIQELEVRLIDKDKQIEDLKNNLGMVISEKAEVIKMKDEMLDLYKEQLEDLKGKLTTENIRQSA